MFSKERKRQGTPHSWRRVSKDVVDEIRVLNGTLDLTAQKFRSNLRFSIPESTKASTIICVRGSQAERAEVWDVNSEPEETLQFTESQSFITRPWPSSLHHLYNSLPASTTY